MKYLSIKSIKDTIAISQYCDNYDYLKKYKTYSHIIREINFFVTKTDYIEYLKSDIKNKISQREFRDNIFYYWSKFRRDIFHLHI